MRHSYQKPVITAYPDIKLPETKISKFAVFIVRIIGGFYIYSLFKSAKVKVKNKKILIDAFEKALSKKTRCIIAFRHPDGREPQLLLWFIMFKLKSLAAKYKTKFAIKPHSVFVYGYEVARWGGWLARFFMPNLGAIPIHHTKIDSKGMARINSAIEDGPYPVAIAPEGQVSYTINSVPRLESGVVRLGFQAASHLKEKNIDAPVEILPLSIYFEYDAKSGKAIINLLKKTEKICGFSNINKNSSGSCGADFKERVLKCREYILSMNETRYGIKYDDAVSYEERLDALVNAALEKAERGLGIKAEGDFFSRLYKVRHHCWDKIFLPENSNLKNMPYLERSVKNLAAGEAWQIARHQELADFAWYFKHPVPAGDAPLAEKAEYIQNLWDFANRTMGGAISNRFYIPCKNIVLAPAPVINLTDNLSIYKENRKTTISEITKKLEDLFLQSAIDK